MAWNPFSVSLTIKKSCQIKLNYERACYGFLKNLPRPEGLAALSGYETAQICASKHRIHILRGLKLLYIHRVSDFPLETKPDIWNEKRCRSQFWRCFELWNVVSCCSIRFNDFRRQVPFVVFPTDSWKEKQKSTFKYSFTIITKASRKLCGELFRGIRKILHTSVPRKGFSTQKLRISAENEVFFNLENFSIYWMIVNQPSGLCFVYLCIRHVCTSIFIIFIAI